MRKALHSEEVTAYISGKEAGKGTRKAEGPPILFNSKCELRKDSKTETVPMLYCGAYV